MCSTLAEHRHGFRDGDVIRISEVFGLDGIENAEFKVRGL